MRKRREHNCIHRKWLTAALACILFWLCLCPAALAIDPINAQEKCTLTVNFRPGGVSGEGTQMKLYQVATMTGFGDFVPLGRFGELDEQMNGLQDGQWDTLALKLISHADSLGITPTAVRTVANGKATFENLPAGLYLISCDVFVRNATYYITNPMLVSLPNHAPDQPDAWTYQVTVNPKDSQIHSSKIIVRKVWQNTTSADRQPVTIHLMVNGRITETVVLTSANDWRAELKTQLQNCESWSVVEATRLNGFQTPQWDWSWDGRNINVYVTNTKKTPYTPSNPGGPTPTPKPNYPSVLPKTGLLWWPVPVLAVCGMLLFGLGWARRRHHG